MTEIRKQVTEQVNSGKLLITQTRDGWLLTKDPQEDDAPAVASAYKDRIFRMISDDREEFIVYTERKENIRLISARPATKTERSIYYDTDSYFG